MLQLGKEKVRSYGFLFVVCSDFIKGNNLCKIVVFRSEVMFELFYMCIDYS